MSELDIPGPEGLSIEERIDGRLGLLLTVRNLGRAPGAFSILDREPGLVSEMRTVRPARTIRIHRAAEGYDVQISAADGFVRRFAGSSQDAATSQAFLKRARSGNGVIIDLASASDAWFCFTNGLQRHSMSRARARPGERLRFRAGLDEDGRYHASIALMGGAFRREFAGRAVDVPRTSD